MKSKLLEFIYKFLVEIINIFNFYKPRIFIYTDSRGYDVVGRSGKNPFKSYISQFLTKYRVTYHLCEEKHTTILDFLELIDGMDLKKYKFIILHCGVVDFSPRPLSNLNWVLKSKEYNNYFKIAVKEYKQYYENPSEILYNNEKTNNLYSIDFLTQIIVPELMKISNLIWINSNFFVDGWEGNFEKGRPKNINSLVVKFDNILEKNLLNFVNLKAWNEDNIKKFTIDNIHFTKDGFAAVYNLINSKMNDLT